MWLMNAFVYRQNDIYDIHTSFEKNTLEKSTTFILHIDNIEE